MKEKVVKFGREEFQWKESGRHDNEERHIPSVSEFCDAMGISTGLWSYYGFTQEEICEDAGIPYPRKRVRKMEEVRKYRKKSIKEKEKPEGIIAKIEKSRKEKSTQKEPKELRKEIYYTRQALKDIGEFYHPKKDLEIVEDYLPTKDTGTLKELRRP